MKKALVLILFIIIVASLFAGCDVIDKKLLNSKLPNGFHYELNESGTEYTVTFIGKKTGADVVIPEEHDGLPVTGIADCAFLGCRRMKSVTIPASITHIGSRAFFGCTRLKDVYISDLSAWCGVSLEYTWISFESNPFAYAENLYVNGELITELVIPEDVERINKAVFYRCPGITSVTIPSGVIGECAFTECRSIKEINIGNGVSAIEIYAFENCTGLEKVYFNAVEMKDPVGLMNSLGVPLYNYIFANAGEKSGGFRVIVGKDATRIPDRLFSSTDAASVISLEFEEGGVCKTIGHYAFENCPELKSAHIPSHVSEIKSYAFSECKSLSEVTLSDGLYSLGYYAFLNCSSLTEIYIPNTIKMLFPSTFGGCTGLTKISVPASVSTFNADIFEGCYNITEISVDENNESFKSVDGNVYTKDGATLVKYAPGKTDAEFKVPEGVVTIGNYAFSGCRNLVSVTIPESVTSIGDYAFNDCAHLKRVNVGANVAKIDNYAFANCICLTEINIPEGVTRIGNYAFRNCRKLKRIVIPESVAEMGANAFLGCEKLTIRCGIGAKPESWDATWNPDDRRVVWGYTDK